MVVGILPGLGCGLVFGRACVRERAFLRAGFYCVAR